MSTLRKLSSARPRSDSESPTGRTAILTVRVRYLPLLGVITRSVRKKCGGSAQEGPIPKYWLFACAAKIGRLPLSYRGVCHNSEMLRASIRHIGTHIFRHSSSQFAGYGVCQWVFSRTSWVTAMSR